MLRMCASRTRIVRSHRICELLKDLNAFAAQRPAGLARMKEDDLMAGAIIMHWTHVSALAQPQ